ncbi:MAG: response regulator transcription factor [Candidatus Aminicenantes bacterium]|nr:response regulator transcription factor [Candidatus Aminicenantes bacterium]
MVESKKKPQILFVEDDINLQKSIGYILEKESFDVVCTGTGEEAIELAKKNPPDLMLLDLILPGLNGFRVCEILKKDRRTENIFIIMLTGKGAIGEIVKGLELYADDYITKPFEPKILIARINAVLRRKLKSVLKDRNFFEFKDLTIDLAAYAVKVAGKDVRLTKTEFDIVALLAGRPNQVFTRARILEHVRSDNYPITERVVDYQVTGLRKKLGLAGDYIKTVRGVGYKFEV